VRYRAFAPPPLLASHVVCVWAREGVAPRVLPDGCADLVWTGERLIVAGPATRAVEPRVRSDEPKLGVRFRIGAAGAGLGLPAVELRDQSPELAEVWPGGAELTERFGEAAGTRARFELLLGAIARHLENSPPADPLVRAAALELEGPSVRLGPLAGRLGISERQLRRRFEAAVGYPPKTLARVLRLQRFLAHAEQGGDLSRLAFDAGYADQAHLTRECTELAGLPAGALLAAGATAAGERLTRG
jgi:AraC-like DNA-binding protein